MACGCLCLGDSLGRGEGACIGLNHLRMCVLKSEGHGSFVSKMSEGISLEIGAKFVS